MPQLQLQSVHWSDPLTGQRMQRRLLGCCLKGKLLMLAHVEPVSTNLSNVYWLCRLPSSPSSYLIEDKERGGCELVELRTAGSGVPAPVSAGKTPTGTNLKIIQGLV